ncbi:MAG: DUF6514 family protein [Oscillospiraceae bacterium]
MGTYELIREKIHREELEDYWSYGITGQDGERTVKVSDISISRENAQQMVDLLNRNGVSLEHMMDLLQDFAGITF